MFEFFFLFQTAVLFGVFAWRELVDAIGPDSPGRLRPMRLGELSVYSPLRTNSIVDAQETVRIIKRHKGEV